MVLLVLTTPVPPLAPLSGLENTGVPETVGALIVGLVARTTVPVPVTPFSPNTPELLYSISPVDPLVIVVEPTVRVLTDAEGEQVEPSVQTVPLMVMLGKTRSPLVTKPVAINAVVTVGLASVALLIVGLVSVLLVRVSVVAFPTNVSVASGKVRVWEPRAPVGGVRVMLPDVALAKASVPTVDPATPSVGVGVNAGPEPARTSPATPVIEMTEPLIFIGGVAVNVPVQLPQVITPVVELIARGDVALLASVPAVVPTIAEELSVNVLEPLLIPVPPTAGENRIVPPVEVIVNTC